MVQQIISPINQEIIYPDSDGKPMAENTENYQWIVKIKENLEILFASNPDVFIAADLLWYPESQKYQDLLAKLQAKGIDINTINDA